MVSSRNSSGVTNSEADQSRIKRKLSPAQYTRRRNAQDIAPKKSTVMTQYNMENYLKLAERLADMAQTDDRLEYLIKSYSGPGLTPSETAELEMHVGFALTVLEYAAEPEKFELR
jgi:hypothetical protein